MNEQIIIPSLGESITEATIVKLFKKVGDLVNLDETILELETEKVNLEVSAKSAGIIETLLKKEGDNVLVGEVIGSIKIGGNISHVETENKTLIKEVVAPENSLHNLKGTLEGTTFPPAVNKLFAENTINPQDVTGSGKRGMITKGDVLEALQQVNTPSSAITESIQPSQSTITPESVKSSLFRSEERVKMSRLRQTIAKRLKDSQNVAAILTTFNEINMSKVMSLRQTYKDVFEKKYNTKLGFMSFFVKAVVDALEIVPAVNAEIQGDEIIYKNYYDIGVAVGGPAGLVVPIIKDCQNLSFSQIEKEIINYSNKAKAGKLSMQDLTGGTFTISNGGVYGSLLSTPIINPPQSGILGLHKIEERPIVVAGKIEIQPMMYVALSYDHRIIDGKDAVTFLVKVKENIENPERLLLNV